MTTYGTDDTTHVGAIEDVNVRLTDTSFEVRKLNSVSELSWAVIGRQSGAVALGEDGQMLLRLREDEAQRIAIRLTKKARDASDADGLSTIL